MDSHHPHLCVSRDSASRFAMNDDEFAHISAALIGAIAEARPDAKQFGIGTKFRDIEDRRVALRHSLPQRSFPPRTRLVGERSNELAACSRASVFTMPLATSTNP